jgi:hypothetical protein
MFAYSTGDTTTAPSYGRMQRMAESASRALLEILAEKLDHYRGWTREYTDAAPDAWIYRPTAWTECTIGWHMGHLAWKLDSYAGIYLNLPATLDAEWKRRFYSEAPLNSEEAPAIAQLREVFSGAHQRFLEGLAPLTDDDLPRADPAWPDGTILGALANLIMHEGEHLAGIEALVWGFKRADG